MLGALTNAPVTHSGLKPALEAAALDQSLVLVVFEADWCGPCKVLKRQTLAAPEFLEKGGPLRLVEIDVDADPKTARAFGVAAIPALFLLTYDNKIVARRTGLLSVAELTAWIEEGRGRVKQGQWEGSLPGSKLDELAAKAAGDQLGSNDLVRLVTMLAEPDPAERASAGKLLLEQREAAVAPLIDALGHSYLGIRISAAELLHSLAPETARVDPWQSPDELAESISGLKKWWAKTGRLPAVKTARELDPAIAGSVKAALNQLGGDDFVRRTEAMSTLAAHGQAALPAVREAIKTAEQAGDLRRLALLEDVRWAVLIPEPVERSAGGVRSALARGKGQERQTAAVRLGRAGRDAISALAELVGDTDPLVVESAVRALSGIGGKDAIPALAALMKAGDSNLRMTAAQGLGHTKNPDAVPPLLLAFEDPNEVVVTTALSALDEVNAEHADSSSKPPQPPEVIQALKKCLSDPRWRVRASAAEVVGKLRVKDLIEDLKTLGDDADGFVVRNALDALRQLGAAPEPAKLLAMARRHPGLREQVVRVLVNWGTDDAVQAVTEFYNAGNVEARVLILRGLGPGQDRAGGSATTAWKPLLTRAAAEPEVRLRRAAAGAAAAQPPEVAKALIPQFLADQDWETRASAAELILNLLSGERPIATSSSDYEDLYVPPMAAQAFDESSKKTNEPPATIEQLAAWHAALKKQADATNLLVAAAMYVTGSSNLDLPALQTALSQADPAALARFAKSTALPAILPRLPWPDGQPLIERLCVSPALFLRALNYAQKMPDKALDFLIEAPRFRAAVEPVSAEDLNWALPGLLQTSRKGWSLFSARPGNEALFSTLLESTNAAWRAAAVYVLGQREEAKPLAAFERAARDPNPWVRAAAIQGLVRAAKERPDLEARLAPLLADADKKVAARAALGLLEPETRDAASLQYDFNRFEFEKIRAGSYSSSSQQGPLTRLETKPAFLDGVRQRLAGAAREDLGRFALLLAQYGDFTGLDRWVERFASEKNQEDQTRQVVLTAIALSRDVKYLPFLKSLGAAAKEEWDVRRILQALKGMSGPEARQLRLELNKRLRQGTE